MRLTERALTLTRLRPVQARGGHHIALSPISWGVSDLRGWGQQLEAERVLAEIAALGVAAIEAGPTGFLPDRSEAARRVLKRHSLHAVAGPVHAVLHHHDIRASELAHIDGHASWLAAIGAHTLILTVISSRSTDETGATLSSGGWAHLLSAIGSVQHVCTVRRLRLAVEPRQGSMIQGPSDIERLLVGSEAGVCLDLAQLVLAGADPIEVIELAEGRIQHVHVNDIDSRQAQRVREGSLDYRSAVTDGMFKTLGAGDADVAAVVDALLKGGYRGWFGLEAETRLASVDDDPMDAVRSSLRYLRSVLPETNHRR